MSNKPLFHHQSSPDWRDPSCYKYTAELTFPQWAWEFLRRNPKYQQDWERWGLETEVSAQTLDRLLSSETPQIAPTTEALVQATIDAATWGLNHPFNPSMTPRAGEPFPVWRKELLGERVFLLNRGHAAETIARAPDEVVFFGLDLRLRLTPQIDFLKQVFEDEREQLGLRPKRITKAHRKTFPNYLRALDADALGIPPKETARALWPNHSDSKRQHRDTLRRAKQLCDAGYIDLVSLKVK